MTTRTRVKPRPVLHPGWMCCDPAQDLAGWVERENARIARLNRWIRVWRQRGTRLRKAALRALLDGNDPLYRALEDAGRAAHGTANAYADRAGVARGHVERVTEAHRPDEAVEV